MFDKKNNPNNADKTPNQAPANLPTGGKGQGGGEPEDILAGIEAPEPSTQGPSQPQTRSEVPPPAGPPPERAETKEPFFKKGKKVIVLVVILILAGAALGFGGWYGYNFYLNSFQLTSEQQQPAVNDSQNANDSAGDTSVNTNINQPPVPPLDTDSDGLSDEDEALYGTDPTKVDTDDDLLTDRDEVEVFETDPNNPDTDGDGFLDGNEVRAGYDPKGPGRLLEIE